MALGGRTRGAPLELAPWSGRASNVRPWCRWLGSALEQAKQSERTSASIFLPVEGRDNDQGCERDSKHKDYDARYGVEDTDRAPAKQARGTSRSPRTTCS